ncbi:phenylalanyl-tRNA synthetase subunit alpha [Pedobacter rhizosphaerae]|nr:phenylalanyl-tRNA synthetase subunit alpha [Pedobacter rhizosphaerae]
MSKEILEFTVELDEKFELQFNWLDSFWAAAAEVLFNIK